MPGCRGAAAHVVCADVDRLRWHGRLAHGLGNLMHAGCADGVIASGGAAVASADVTGDDVCRVCLSVPGSVEKLPWTPAARPVTVVGGQLILADTPGADTFIDLAAREERRARR